MFLVASGIVLGLAAVASLAAARAGAACTPATHRARLAVAAACAGFAALQVARMIDFLAVRGHPIGASAIAGGLVALTFAAQAWLLARPPRLGRGAAIALGAWCAAWGVIGVAAGLR